MTILGTRSRPCSRGTATSRSIGTVGSHSALDIADGAVTEGFRTLVLAQAGREATYQRYFRARRDAAGIDRARLRRRGLDVPQVPRSPRGCRAGEAPRPSRAPGPEPGAELVRSAR